MCRKLSGAYSKPLTEVFQGALGDVSKGHTEVFQGPYEVFQGAILKCFKGPMKCFEGLTKVFQGAWGVFKTRNQMRVAIQSVCVPKILAL